MNTFVCKACDATIVGPFGVAPFTNWNWVNVSLLERPPSPIANTSANIDSAMGTFACISNIDKFSVVASSDRLILRTIDATPENADFLGVMVSRVAKQFPFSMAVAIGFNVEYEITCDESSWRDVVKSRIGEIGPTVSLSQTYRLDSDARLEIRIDIIDAENRKARVMLNFDKRLVSALESTPPLMVAKNWCQETSLASRLEFAKQIIVAKWGSQNVA